MQPCADLLDAVIVAPGLRSLADLSNEALDLASVQLKVFLILSGGVVRFPWPSDREDAHRLDHRLVLVELEVRDARV